MATRRIKEITNTATTFASDDFIALDGTTQGTRKMDKDDLIAEVSAGVSGDYLEEANNLSDVASLDTSKLNMEIPDVGTAPNEVPLSGQLGTMAFQDASGVSVGQLEVTDKVKGPLGIDGSPGSYAYSGADDLVVGDASGSRGITISTGSSDTGALYFGDAASTGLESYRGMVRYSHSSDKLELGTLSQVRAVIDSSGNVKLAGDETELQFNSDTQVGDNVRARIQCEGQTGTYGYGGDLVFKTTADDNTSAERVRIDSEGRLGVNQSSPGSYSSSGYDLVVGTNSGNHGATIVAGSTSTGSLFFADGTGFGAYRGRVQYNHNADQLYLGASANTNWKIDGATGNFVRVSAGAGIDFGTTTTGSGVTVSDGILSDYEVGTWEPTYAPSSGSFTTVTMTRDTAMYVKVGKQVTVFGYILTSDLNTTGGSGNVQISGLPFISSNPGFSSVSVGYTSNWGTNHPAGGYVASNASVIYLTERKTDIHGALSEMAVSNLNSVTGANYNALMFSATYLTTS